MASLWLYAGLLIILSADNDSIDDKCTCKSHDYVACKLGEGSNCNFGEEYVEQLQKILMANCF